MEYHDHKAIPINWSKVKGALWPRIVMVSENLKAQSLAEKSTAGGGSGASVSKQIQVWRPGQIKTKFSFWGNSLCYFKLYVDSVELYSYGISGIYNTNTWYTVENDVYIKFGSIIEIMGHNFNVGQTAKIKDFKLYWDYDIIKDNNKIILN